ncbi:MAG TPA: DegV family protein [Acidimicrobiales bacterium]|nr:DegV family protein [Acidimicrobiales bacterium]
MIRVVTDSACDLPDGLVTELGIGIVPLRIRFGAEELVDRVELAPKEFWARCAAAKELPETSAPSPGMFAAEYRRMAESGAQGVVCVTISSKLSATGEAARQAARELADEIPVRVVDSSSVTLGEGLVVQAAAEAAAAGGDLDAVAAAAEGLVGSLRVFGAIDTLENLKKGGRIGGAQALMGSMLAIKPVIEVRGGQVEQESKQRTRGRSLQYLADKVKAAGPLARVAVMSADADDLDTFLGMLGDLPSATPLLQGEIGSVIGTHIGKGAIGVAFVPAG